MDWSLTQVLGHGLNDSPPPEAAGVGHSCHFIFTNSDCGSFASASRGFANGFAEDLVNATRLLHAEAPGLGGGRRVGSAPGADRF